MIRKIFAAMMAIVGISSLSGCVPNMTAAYVYCEVEAPITWSTKDTDQTIAEVKSHNAVFKSLCPNKKK